MYQIFFLDLVTYCSHSLHIGSGDKDTAQRFHEHLLDKQQRKRKRLENKDSPDKTGKIKADSEPPSVKNWYPNISEVEVPSL